MTKNDENNYKTFQSIGNALKNAFSSFNNSQTITKALSDSLIASTKALESKAEEAVRGITRSVVGLQDHFSKIKLPDFSSTIKPVIDFQNAFSKVLKPFQIDLRRLFDGFTPLMKKGITMLANQGWFIDFEMPASVFKDIIKIINEGKFAIYERKLISYFEKDLDRIESDIIKRFKNRKKLINASFNAHRRKEYILSIPVILAQVDGICYEVVKQSFFMKHNQRPSTATYVDNVATDTFRYAVLFPLSQKLPINYSSHERLKRSRQLNRHAVFHGESVTYGSKKNSIKAISLLNYVSYVLWDEKQYRKKHS
jgi:hypothetical protein